MACRLYNTERCLQKSKSGTLQLVNILQTKIFQTDVVDAVLVKPWHDMITHRSLSRHPFVTTTWAATAMHLQR